MKRRRKRKARMLEGLILLLFSLIQSSGLKHISPKSASHANKEINERNGRRPW